MVVAITKSYRKFIQIIVMSLSMKYDCKKHLKNFQTFFFFEQNHTFSQRQTIWQSVWEESLIKNEMCSGNMIKHMQKSEKLWGSCNF